MRVIGALAISPAIATLLVAAACALGIIVLFAPPRVRRFQLMAWGAVGLALMAAAGVAPNMQILVLAVLGLGVLQSTLPGRRAPASRLRAPLLAAALLAGGVLLAGAGGPPLLSRLAAVALVGGLGVAVGIMPFLHDFDPEEPSTASSVPWAAFIGPVVALAIVMRARELVPDSAAAFGAMLIGLGLLNIGWGSIAAWRTASTVAAWRYSFIADWGLALCGFGVGLPDGAAGAQLVLFAIVLGRLPLYLWSRPALRESIQMDRPLNLFVAAALAGAAPLAGFPARLLLLRGATQLYWPLALVLAPAFLLWLPGSIRLGRSLGRPTGAIALGVGVTLAIAIIFGLYPQPFLALAGF